MGRLTNWTGSKGRIGNTLRLQPKLAQILGTKQRESNKIVRTPIIQDGLLPIPAFKPRYAAKDRISKTGKYPWKNGTRGPRWKKRTTEDPED